ncbi:hypothetical protein RclHR1_11320007 [Rhizophagus clarus]|uniref:Uncharacterized protein n=1 Tax=Rhizophagus clarus TaxID=94130 RepID=A0A2Z6Q467_9GLOM|nr:hypothetical protein RclHR1_11320007 [Rhizophagus clarus]GES76903.1 hypothetical protein GLOIN_2v1590553 [Rhizophagus clarus]
MTTINLGLLQNPNFPSLEILESRTKIVLENFNRCRKLNIKLHIKNDKIEEFSRLFNSITERRALESLRLSMYAEDVDIYINLLSEENTSVGVILETLSSLLDAAQERHEITKKLKEDYQEFFYKFNNEFANIEIDLTSDTSDSRELIIRGNSAAIPVSEKKSVIVKAIVKYGPLLIACGVFGYTFYKFPQYLNPEFVPLLVPLFEKGKEFLLKKYQGNQDLVEIKDNRNLVETKGSQERLQDDKTGLKETKNVEDNRRNNESRQTDGDTTPSSTVSTSTASTLLTKCGEEVVLDVYNEFGKEVVFDPKIRPTPSSTVSTSLTKNVQSGENWTDSILNEVTESLQKKGYSIPSLNFEDMNVDEHAPTPIPQTASSIDATPISPPSVSATPTPNVPIKNADPNSLVGRILTAGIFSILIYYSMRKILRPAKRSWDYIMNPNNKPKSRQILQEQQQNIEKCTKIQEIKEKLPVIIQNVEILDQFWDHQITNIKSHIKTLKSVDENEKIRFPQQIAAPIKKNWNKQYSESKANYNRLKELVTINSLLSPD